MFSASVSISHQLVLCVLPVRATLCSVRSCFLLALRSGTSPHVHCSAEPHSGIRPSPSDAPFKQRPVGRDLAQFYACTFPKWQKCIIEIHSQGYSGSTDWGDWGGGGEKEKESPCACQGGTCSFLIIPRPVWVASFTHLPGWPNPGHRQQEDPKSQRITCSADWNQHTTRAGPLHVGETRSSSQAQPHLLRKWLSPWAGPPTAPPWDTSLLTCHKRRTSGVGHT